jgi:GTPase involved in cell partitioning and DNA repair
VRSGPGAARTILLVHIISARPSKQPPMVRTFRKVYMELGSYFLFLQEQINDIIIIGERRDQVRFNAAAERARIKPAVRAAVGRQF